jgi:hypothetical protein
MSCMLKTMSRQETSGCISFLKHIRASRIEYTGAEERKPPTIACSQSPIKPALADARVGYMKYIKILSIFVFGLIVGALAVGYLSVPARKAYRQYLQQMYLNEQCTLAYSALRHGRNLEATVHFWNNLEADPVDGSKLFNPEDAKAVDQGLGFFLLPQINKYFKTLVDRTPRAKEKELGLAHGKLAVALERLGYQREANEHWSKSAELLNISVDRTRRFFEEFIRKRTEGKE